MSIKTLRPGDKNWLITDGLVCAQRAAFELSQDCPHEYALVLQKCIQNNWIKPIACVHDKELTWDSLR